MKARLLTVAVLFAALFAAGCNQQEMQRQHEERVRAWNEMWGIDDGGGPRVGDKETWTIECNAYTGENRREMADRMASLLKRVADVDARQVRVSHEAERSCVYYGEYDLSYVRAETDSEEHTKGDVYVALNEAIKRDLRFVRQLSIGSQFPFFSARPIPKPTEDVGPPEWDLRNARGVYTLHVGVTYNTPTMHAYKQAAVEWVKALRSDGYEAYYYHSPDEPRSSICVGTFGDDALIQWQETIDDQQVTRSRYSDEVEALRARADFAYNLENGVKVFRTARNPDTGETARMPNKSFLVRIPRGKDTLSGL